MPRDRFGHKRVAAAETDQSRAQVREREVSRVIETPQTWGYTRDMAQAPSPEIVERFRQAYEFWNCGEPDLMVDEYAEDGEVDFSAVFTGMAVFRGHDSIRRQLDEFWETWEGVRMDPLEVFDIGEGQFVVDLRFWGKGRRSGVEIDQRSAFLYTLRESDGKVVRAQLFPTVQAAMNRAGGSRSPVPTD